MLAPLKSLGIKRQLTGAFLLIASISLIVAGGAYLLLGSAQNALIEDTLVRAQSRFVAEHLSAKAFAFNNTVSELLLNAGRPAEKAFLRIEYAQRKKDLLTVASSIVPPQEDVSASETGQHRQQADQVMVSLQTMIVRGDRLIAAADKDVTIFGPQTQAAMKEYDSIRARFLADIGKLQESLAVDLEASQARAMRSADMSRVAQIVFTALTLLAAVALGLRFSTEITRPIFDLISVTKAISAGDLSVKVAGDATGELGILSQTIDDMTKALNDSDRTAKTYLESTTGDLMKFVEKVAAEDLDIRLDINGSKNVSSRPGTEQQRTGMNQIATIMNSVSQAMNQTLATGKQTEQAAERLSRLAGHLKELKTA